MKVEVQYTHSVKTETSISVPEAGKEAEEIDLSAKVTVALSQPVTLGGFASMTSVSGSGTAEYGRKSGTRYVLVLNEYPLHSD
jgi:hypothetical protein